MKRETKACGGPIRRREGSVMQGEEGREWAKEASLRGVTLISAVCSAEESPIPRTEARREMSIPKESKRWASQRRSGKTSYMRSASRRIRVKEMAREGEGSSELGVGISRIRWKHGVAFGIDNC